MTQIHPSRFSTVRAVTGLALLVWLVAAIVAATTDLVNRPGQPPLILLSFTVVPIALGVVAYRLSPSLRAWTDRFSLTWMVGLTPGDSSALGSWRPGCSAGCRAGLRFRKVLVMPWPRPAPSRFCPALTRNRVADVAARLEHVRARQFLSALMVGVLYSNGPLGVLSRGGVTTELMVTFPVSLIPTFLVPLFILLHLLTFPRLARHQVPTERDEAIAGPKAVVHAH